MDPVHADRFNPAEQVLPGWNWLMEFGIDQGFVIRDCWITH
jgi:hypothetical protein